MLAWEHERFSFKRISAATISHYRHHNDPQRTSMFHMKLCVIISSLCCICIELTWIYFTEM
jgi:hypothetical protein